MTTFVYKLTDLAGRDRYVGITDDVKGRAYRHRLYQKKEHIFVVLSEHKTRENAGLEEIRLIKELKTHVSNGGWNKTWGAEYANISGMSRKGIGGKKKGCYNASWAPSEETRKLWSEQRKGKGYPKFKEDTLKKIVELYVQRPALPVMKKRGSVKEYETVFGIVYSEQFEMKPAAITAFIKGKNQRWKHLL